MTTNRIALRSAALRAGPALLLAALMPKCPLCVAALLSSLGVGAALSRHVSPWLLTSALVLAAVAAVLPFGIRVVTRHARSKTPGLSCCAIDRR